jgi:predicted transcriptional regulator
MQVAHEMKTASIPPLRVDPELRSAAQGVLADGESLSSFVEESIRLGIERRRAQQEFVSRGLAARAEARRSGKYYPARQVLEDLDALLLKAGAGSRKRR